MDGQKYGCAVPPEDVDTWEGSLIFIKLGVLSDDKFIMKITRCVFGERSEPTLSLICPCK